MQLCGKDREMKDIKEIMGLGIPELRGVVIEESSDSSLAIARMELIVPEKKLIIADERDLAVETGFIVCESKIVTIPHMDEEVLESGIIIA